MNDEARVAFAARARVFKAMAHESRLFILHVLAAGERTVGELTELVGADVSTVSRHLSVLREAGLVGSRRQGQQVFYEHLCPCCETFFECVDGVLARNARRGEAEVAAAAWSARRGEAEVAVAAWSARRGR